MADSTAETGVRNLGMSIRETLDGVIHQVLDHAPETVGAVLVLFLGWLIAKMLSLSARKLVQSLDTLFTRIFRANSRKQEKFKHFYSVAVTKSVFWVVMIFFLAVAFNILGWDLFSGWMQQIFNYLPGLITGILIIIGGLILGRISRSAVISAVEKEGTLQSAFIATLVQVAIVFCAILIGVEQIGLNLEFLSSIVITVVGILLAGAALAFALGARELMANVIGARYLQRHCSPGDVVRMGGVNGEVIEISHASVVIQTSDGKAIVPAELFHRQVTLVESTRN